MDEWNRTQHRKSGLWQRVLDSDVGIAEAEARTLAFLARMGAGQCLADVRQLDLPGPPFPAPADAGAGKALPLPQPRRQHAQGTGPALGAARCWPGVRKHAAHTALSDVRDSIAELAYYRQHMGTLAGLDGTKPPV